VKLVSEPDVSTGRQGSTSNSGSNAGADCRDPWIRSFLCAWSLRIHGAQRGDGRR